jgi:chemotaxis receptor (MCP) glutamine deamidase CheD
MAETSVKLLQYSVANKGLLKIDRIGAGVGVIFYSAAHKTGAGLHILAPNSVSAQLKNPVMYANTAIPYALEQLGKKGVPPPYSIAIAGGAVMLGDDDGTGMGHKVVEAVREAFAKVHLLIKLDQTGGAKVRSMVLDIDAGKISIS